MTLSGRLRRIGRMMEKGSALRDPRIILEAAERIEALESAICLRCPQQDGTAGPVEPDEESDAMALIDQFAR